MATRSCLLALLVGLSGCLLQNLTPEVRMRDAVLELNEGARWGRMDVASGYVVPSFRPQFQASHIRWGRDIQIADTEIIGMNPETDDEGEGAYSRIAVRWYDQSTMVLANTVIRQTLQKHKQTFLLTSESVESGHPGLLMIPDGVNVVAATEEAEVDTVSDEEAQWDSVY